MNDDDDVGEGPLQPAPVTGSETEEMSRESTKNYGVPEVHRLPGERGLRLNCECEFPKVQESFLSHLSM